MGEGLPGSCPQGRQLEVELIKIVGDLETAQHECFEDVTSCEIANASESNHTFKHDRAHMCAPALHRLHIRRSFFTKSCWPVYKMSCVASTSLLRSHVCVTSSEEIYRRRNQLFKSRFTLYDAPFNVDRAHLRTQVTA